VNQQNLLSADFADGADLYITVQAKSKASRAEPLRRGEQQEKQIKTLSFPASLRLSAKMFLVSTCENKEHKRAE
jgi:hypothetical protein